MYKYTMKNKMWCIDKCDDNIICSYQNDEKTMLAKLGSQFITATVEQL